MGERIIMKKQYSEPDMYRVSVVVKDVIMESTYESNGFDWSEKWEDETESQSSN